MVNIKIIIFTLLIAMAYLQGWNEGYEVGYDSGIADVFLNLVDPNTFFEKELKK